MVAPNSPTSKVAIRLDGVSKRYTLYKNDRHRLVSIFSRRVPHKVVCANEGLSFSIEKGESVAIFGRNGAGKSTLLKMISGVTFPTSGTVDVSGRVSALLELTAGFDNKLTGRENVRLRGQIWGLDARELAEFEQATIEFADIGDYVDQPVRTYSSGMKARLGFAISVNINPDILIIDEALSVGDVAFRKKSDIRIKEIMEREEVTVILVTHSSNSVRAISTRGLVLDCGQLVFDGGIEDAIAYYEKSSAARPHTRSDD